MQGKCGLLKHFLEELPAKEGCVFCLENQNTESEKNKHDLTSSGFCSENRELKSQKNQDLFIV